MNTMKSGTEIILETRKRLEFKNVSKCKSGNSYSECKLCSL
jgi:hypothetical protein